ncbi:STAS domain-containing protein [Dactylosporangium roseum]|uniref:STAS domain-containing protein n=1 Tax=Dactylosporangium roseum TaxID=47989 RepID=A0ABY5ZCY5_9ACTN|nr:STAS domain-containing protein [Dactylosporangium roseum]UWZ39965.1 STAS domain-containing protein [Dactylosporangium roseum]
MTGPEVTRPERSGEHTASGPVRLDIEGELTVLTAAEHHERLQRFLAEGPWLEVGLSAVTELDTAGLQVLLLARGEAERRGAALRLCAPSPAVRDVLALAWLTPDLADAADAADAEEAA